MRRLLHILCAAACCWSCTRGYRIVGESNIQDLDGRTISLRVAHDEGWHTLDSCEVIHGQFRMKGKADSVRVATLFLDEHAVMPVIVEPGKIDITVSNIALKAQGSPLNDSLYRFIAQKHQLDLRAAELDRLEARMIIDGYDGATIQHRVDSTYQVLRDEMQQLVLQFICDNYDNALALCGFSMLCNGLPYPIITPLIQAVIDNAPAEFLAHPTIKGFMEEAKRY